jgi:hypothetical protein
VVGGGARRFGDFGGSEVGTLSSDAPWGPEGDKRSLGEGGLWVEGSLRVRRIAALGLEELGAWLSEEEPWLLTADSENWSDRKWVSIRSLEASFADTALIRLARLAVLLVSR